MTEPIVTDEEIHLAMKGAGEDCGATAYTPGESTVKYSFALSKRLIALIRRRLAERLTMSDADKKQARANSGDPRWTGGYIAGRQEGVRIVEADE